MQTQINIELPEYNEDGELVAAVDRHVAAQVVRELKDEAKAQVRKIIVERATSDIEAIVMEAINGPTQLTSIYGEPKGDPITLRERIMAIAAKHLDDKVDARDGSSPGYNSTKCSRVEWMVKKAVNDAVAKQVAVVHDRIRKEASAAMAKWLADNAAE
jgi:hypothetical protein